MVHPRSRQKTHDEPLTTAQLAALYADCVRAVRDRAPQARWQDLSQRIAGCTQRLEQPIEPAAACTCCGARRPTSTLHILAPRDSDSRWRLCFRCWKLLELGLTTPRGEARAATPARLTDAEVRGSIRAGAARLDR